MSSNDLIPEISIVIPAYNSEKTVLRSIEGLLNQDIINCELVIVNDGSTDNTKKVVLDLIEKEGQKNNIKLINQQNRGLGGARNTGIINSTGNYITFLDSDDTLDLNVVKEAADKAKSGNYDIVMFKFRRVGEHKDFIRYLRPVDSAGVEGINQYFYESTSGAATARVYDRNFLISNGLSFPEKRYHEDLQFTGMAYYLAKKTSYINKIGYDWIVRDGSITSSVNTSHIDGFIDSLMDIKKFLYDQDIVEQTMSKFIVFCCKHLNGLVYKIAFLHDEKNTKKELFRYLYKRIIELDINNYNYFIWKNFHTNQFIKNFNKMAYYNGVLTSS